MRSILVAGLYVALALAAPAPAPIPIAALDATETTETSQGADAWPWGGSGSSSNRKNGGSNPNGGGLFGLGGSSRPKPTGSSWPSLFGGGSKPSSSGGLFGGSSGGSLFGGSNGGSLFGGSNSGGGLGGLLKGWPKPGGDSSPSPPKAEVPPQPEAAEAPATEAVPEVAPAVEIPKPEAESAAPPKAESPPASAEAEHSAPPKAEIPPASLESEHSAPPAADAGTGTGVPELNLTPEHSGETLHDSAASPKAEAPESTSETHHESAAPPKTETPKAEAKPKPAKKPQEAPVSRGKLWQPKVGSKFQIILHNVPDTSQPLEPVDAKIWDIDLFDTSKTHIGNLKKRGLNVICYFSAGTSEDWRPDYAQLKAYGSGDVCDDAKCTSKWQGERWLNIKNAKSWSVQTPTQELPPVWRVMRTRIKMAHEKGCDAIDPDNMDGFDNKNSYKLTEADSINFIKFMAAEAAQYNMSTGLKNAIAILPKVEEYVQFAVNEECVQNKECGGYRKFLNSGKPVFHIEYTADGTASRGGNALYRDVGSATKKYCNPLGPTARFSTIIKGKSLNGKYLYCDGSLPGQTKTVKVEGSGGGLNKKGGKWAEMDEAEEVSGEEAGAEVGQVHEAAETEEHEEAWEAGSGDEV